LERAVVEHSNDVLLVSIKKWSIFYFPLVTNVFGQKYAENYRKTAFRES